MASQASQAAARVAALPLRQQMPERIVLREFYRQKADLFEENRAELSRPDDTQMIGILDEIEAKSKEVKEALEFRMDTSVMKTAAEIVHTQARSLSTGQEKLLPENLAAQLMALFDVSSARPAPLFFHKLAKRATEVLRFTPQPTFMLGPLSMPPKMARKRSAPLPKQPPVGPAETPTTRTGAELKAADGGASIEIQRRFTLMNKQIKRSHQEIKAPVHMAHLIVQPQPLNEVGFGVTIENLFSLSFLVRSGDVEAVVGADGRMAVVPADRAADEADGRRKTKQCIFRMTYDDYERMARSTPAGLMPAPSHIDKPHATASPVRLTAPAAAIAAKRRSSSSARPNDSDDQGADADPSPLSSAAAAPAAAGVKVAAGAAAALGRKRRAARPSSYNTNEDDDDD